MTNKKTTAAMLYDLRTANISSDLCAIATLTAGKSVLEVGCGTGRIIKALVNNGCPRIVGIECDEEKLRLATGDPAIAKASGVSLYAADFLAYETNERFERVLFCFNVLCEFTDVQKRITVLKAASSLLVENGQIVVACAIEDFNSLAKERMTYTFTIGEGAEAWDVRIDAQRRHIEQISDCVLLYKNRKTGEEVCDRYTSSLLTRNELLATYSAAGLRVTAEYGGYDLSMLSCESKTLIHVLDKA